MLGPIIRNGIFCFFILSFSLNCYANDKLTVFVSIVPQKYFVQRIGKDLIDVHVMVKPGNSPHTYEPKPKQMAALSKSKIYFSIGVPFEKAWLKKISSANPEMRVVPTDDGIEKLPVAAHQHEEEGYHEETKKHAEGGLDPHIWTSPTLVMVQARNIMYALQQVDPAHISIYGVNYRSFISELVNLDIDLVNTFAGQRSRKFMVFHPSWAYFAKAYGLEQIPIEIEGKAPKPAQLMDLINHAREHKIKTVFVQPQFSTKGAKRIADEIDGYVIIADPLAENWHKNLMEVAKSFTVSMQ
jgi:zinc transport system substrate-binding protein